MNIPLSGKEKAGGTNKTNGGEVGGLAHGERLPRRLFLLRQSHFMIKGKAGRNKASTFPSMCFGSTHSFMHD